MTTTPDQTSFSSVSMLTTSARRSARRMQITSQGVEAKGYAEYLKKQAEKK